MHSPSEWSDLYWRLLEALVLVVTTLNSILLARLHRRRQRAEPVQPTYRRLREHVHRVRVRGRAHKRPRE